MKEINYKKLKQEDRIEYNYNGDKVVGVILKINFKKKMVWVLPMMKVPTKEFQPFPNNLCFYKKWIKFEEINLLFENRYKENLE